MNQTARKWLVPLFALFLTGAFPMKAAPVVFFGEDLGLGENTKLPAHPTADAARDAFLASLVGVGTENFEGYADNTGGPLAINFVGAGTATLQGSGYVNTVTPGTNGVGRYPISGTNYWESGSGFSIQFSDPVAAFGFYGIDIGDFSGQVTMTLADGSDTLVNIPNTIDGFGGSVLFFGYIDVLKPFTSITFGNTAPGTDFFGFDDMTIGSVRQVRVPETGVTLFMLAGALVGIGALRRRQCA